MASTRDSVQFSIGRIASIACLLEVCAVKPGNVHRGADFDDLTFTDFVISAEIMGQVVDSRTSPSIGKLIYDVVDSTSSIVSTNTNLGIALLICPLAVVANDEALSPTSVRRKLKQMTSEDSQFVYQAIRIARPAGLGTAEEMDIQAEPPADILSAMQYSSDQDLIARQYSNNFQQVFEEVVPLLVAGQSQFGKISESIIYTHVSMIARYGDSLIQRKCGNDESEKAKDLARKALEQLVKNSRDAYYSAIGELDFWMRSDGHRRNPGTTADMIAAGLFVGMVNEKISAPFI